MTSDLTLTLRFETSRSPSSPETTAIWVNRHANYEHSRYRYQDRNNNFISCERRHGHLFRLLGEALDAVDIDVAIIHDGSHVAAVGADCHCADGTVTGTQMEKQPATFDVDEAHHAVLTQHTESLFTC